MHAFSMSYWQNFHLSNKHFSSVHKKALKHIQHLPFIPGGSASEPVVLCGFTMILKSCSQIERQVTKIQMQLSRCVFDGSCIEISLSHYFVKFYTVIIYIHGSDRQSAPKISPVTQADTLSFEKTTVLNV